MKQKLSRPFGYHLMLDLYECRSKELENIQYCYDLLERAVRAVRMQTQSPPYLFLSDAKRFPDKAGISGWVPLIESGLMIHTLSRKRAVFIDLFSCRKFPVERVTAMFKRAFRAKRLERYFVERGRSYYR